MKQPLDSIAQELAGFQWDYTDAGVSLTKRHLFDALNRYVAGAITVADLEMWANLIEGREDVQVDKSDEACIADLLHELANPLITQPLTRDRAEQLIRSL